MSARHLLRNLLDYVLEQDKSIDPKGFKLSVHKGFQSAKPDLQGLPGVDFDIKVQGDHIWLRIERLEATSPPLLPPSPLRRYILTGAIPNGPAAQIDEVALRHHFAEANQKMSLAQRSVAETEARQQLQAVMEAYRPLWNAWAEGEKPRRRTIDLYGDFFALKHQLSTEETAKPHELVWGVGVAAWKLDCIEKGGLTKVDFQYPLLTQAVELALNERTLAIELRPRAVGPRLEFDVFAACELHSTADVEKVAREALQRTADRPVSPFDVGSYEHILKLIAGNLHEKGGFASGATAFPTASENLQISDAWVILARPRSKNYLHDDIERLKARLGENVELPLGPMALVTAASKEKVDYSPVTFRGLSGLSGGVRSASGKAKELFFPLPYNHEQVTIIEQLERSDGVAVQGPPGTGKTHTIANIVCHYLATGRKVLVTAKGEQALEVLQSKIPAAVRPLTVALLSGDREGLRQFQSSIEAIIHNLSQLIPEVVREQIRTGESAIDRAHAELGAIDRRIDEIAHTQLSDVEVDGVEMRAQQMAELVLSGAEKHGWFDDELSLDAANTPPLTGAETAKLREARRRLGRDLVYAAARIPSSTALLDAASIGQLHQVLVSMRTIEATEARGGLLALRATTPEVLEDARKMLAETESALKLSRELEETGEVWTAELRMKCGKSSFTSERRALEALFGEVDLLIASRAEFLKRPVEMPEQALSSAKVREAIARGAESGKAFGMLSFGRSDAKEVVGAIRVAGLAPASSDDWQHVVRYLTLHSQVLSFSARWKEFAELLSVPAFSGSVTALRHIELVSTNARKAHRLAGYDASLPKLAERVFAHPELPSVITSTRLEVVREHLRNHLTRADLAQTATSLATLQEKLAGTSGPVSARLRTFVDNELGDGAIPSERVVAHYAELVSDVRRVEALGHDLGCVNELAERLERAGAPRLAARIRGDAVGSSGDDAAFPVSWRDAWNWARVKAHLDAIEAREELRNLAARRRDLEAGLARLYEDLVSKAAWLSTKLGATANVLTALGSYKTAVRRIGQGTGPNAIRYRRDAQKAMQDAQGAVPCWVMSHAKVSETLPAQLGSFDLVIVDEASQSDLWALPAVLRGKKILVVGDDKQVSPDGGFISSARIQELKDRFLHDQPHAADLTPEKSLYDLASAVFAAHKVMLREHFRCVPPIIAYSNTFYDGFIQPLRIPKASERLDPPLVDIYMTSGRRDAKDVNRCEAEAIVEEIEALLSDPQCAGRTIGVIPLLGMEQAKYIDTLVRSRIDGLELQRRRFECGEARLFQGSERDIMFLSMVVDPGSCKALSGNASEQRFNVAASRARDRMYLIRSVNLSDLSLVDLRRGLLSHFGKPMDGGVVEAKSLIDACESGFEKDVYTALFSRGYRVVPQVKAGSFRIDMVVEGADDARLAIECDGDEFHGPDRWAADMGRQRVLERAGWTFWRCFASTWSMRKDEVIKELLDRLTAMGIEPLGALERVPSLVEYRPWVPKAVRAANGAGNADDAEFAQATDVTEIAQVVEGAVGARGAVGADSAKAVKDANDATVKALEEAVAARAP